jgi:hypothetical protein
MGKFRRLRRANGNGHGAGRDGTSLNLEEPERFNGLVGEFLRTVDAGRWSM